jgi:hypothetical protein
MPDHSAPTLGYLAEAPAPVTGIDVSYIGVVLIV